MQNTADKILTLSKECFFQHGFSNTNIALISRTIGISRVTIHKQFGSKEQLFTAVVKRHMEESIALAKAHKKPFNDFWQALSDLLLEWCRPAFEEIANDAVRADLIHAGTKLCLDEVECKHQEMCEIIEYLVTQGIEKNQISLKRLQMTPTQFAATIEGLFSGLIFSGSHGRPAIPTDDFFSVLKAATTP